MQRLFTNQTAGKRQWRWLSLILLALAIGSGHSAQAQTWQQALSGGTASTGGTSAPKATAIDASGNVLMVGTFSGTVVFGGTALTSAGNSDIFLAKWNPTTATWLWAVRAGGTSSDFGGGVAVTGSSVYLTGSISSAANTVVAGTALAGVGGQDIVLAKYTDNGSSVSNAWAVSAGGSGDDFSNGVVVNGSSVYIAGVYADGNNASISGMSLSGLGGTEAFVAKYTDNGATVANGWAATAGGTANDYANGLAVSGSSVYVTGLFVSNTGARIAGQTLTGAGGRDIFLAKYTDTGSTYTNGWVTPGGGFNEDIGYGVAVNGTNVYMSGFFGSFSGAVIAGGTINGSGGTDVVIAKYTDNGSSFTNVWARSSGGVADDFCEGLAVNGTNIYFIGRFTSNSSAVFASTSLSGAGDADAMVARYIDGGTTVSAGGAVSAGGTGTDLGYTLAANASNVYATVGTGTTPATFGSFSAPANTAVLGKLGAGSAFGTWQQVAYPTTFSTGANTVGVTTDASGNALVTGYFSGIATFGSTQLVSAGGSDLFVAKWNSTANAWAWAVRAGGIGNESGRSVAVSNGSVYVSGEFASNTGAVVAGSVLTGAGGQDAFLAKFTDAGSSATGVWAVSGGGTGDDYGKGVAVSGTNVYLTADFVSGTTARFAGVTLPGAGLNDFVLARYTDNGSTVANGWAVSGGGTNNDYVNSVAVSGSNIYLAGIFFSGANALIAGRTLTGLGSYDAFLAKYVNIGSSAAGTWATSAGGTDNDLAQSVAVNGTAVYLAGAFRSGTAASFAGTTFTGAGNQDIVLAKYIDNGSTVANGWARSGGGTGDDYGFGVAVSGTTVYLTGRYASSSATVAGSTLVDAGDTDLFVAAYTDAGSSATSLWARSGGGTGADQGETVAAGLSGAVFVGGQTTPVANFGGLGIATPVGTAVDFLGRLGAEAVTVTSFSPTHGVAGTAVSLSGTGLGTTTSVRFNGVAAASFTVNSATSVTAVVPVGATTGTISLTTSAGNNASSAGSFTVDQPSATRLLLDGYREARYGAALAVQTTPTGFGNATNGSSTNAIGGSELDAAYAQVRGDSLYVFLAGNLENNGNTLDVFFDSQTGGQNILTGTNPNVDNNGLNAMAGLGFDTGFTADYYLGLRGLASGGVVQAHFASLGAGGVGSSPASTGTGQVMSLTLPSGRTGTLAIDNSNTGGINDATVGTGVPAAVVTGLEFVLPLSAIGLATSTTGSLKVSAFVNGGSHDYLSNQVLGGLPNGTANLTGPAGVNFASQAGNQFFTINFPRATALSPNSGPVGTTLTLTGLNLTGATSISFTSSTGTIVVTTGFTVASSTSITGIVVPSGAITGPVTVTTANGTSNGIAFTVTTVTPLAITAVSPVANTRNGARTSPVQVTFNQNITAGSGAALKVFSAQRGGLRSTGSGTTTVSGSTATFAPTYDFKPGETVQATVTTAATATAGGSLPTARVVQFTTAATGGTGIFSGGSDPAVGLYPYGVAVGDVDGDGDLDLLASHDDNNAVSVRLNNGLGVFGGTTEVPVGRLPRSVAVGDVDGDGDLDLLTSNYGANTVSVRFNNGSGTFGGGSEVPVGPHTLDNVFSVALADVDGDGDLDILAASNNGNTVSIRLNNGNGVFGGGSDPAVGSGPYMAAVGDVDGDGDLDLLTPNSNIGTVSVRLNNGLGVFGSGSDLAVGQYPQSVAVGDVDGDGDLDLLTANANTNGTVSVRLNNGAGVFGGGAEVAVGNVPYSVVLSDVDGDGDLDLLTANQSNSSASVRLNNGSGVFGGGTDPAVGVGPTNIAMGDVDGDGDLDLLTTNLGGSVSVRFNNLAVPVPTLTSLSPTSGLVGTSVTITGTNLTGATIVSFNGTPATITNNTGTSLTVAVPSGATTGNVTVTTSGGTSNGLPFTVTVLPVITSFTPTSGGTGTTVTITGSGFVSGGTTVTLNGVAISGVVVNGSGTSLTFTVPAGATGGSLTVTTAGGTTTSTATFCVPYVAGTTGASRCGAGSVTLAASGAPTGGSYAWYAQSTGGTAISGATTGSYTTPSLSATAVYYVSIMTGSGSTACEGPRTAVTATINTVPVVTIAANGPVDFCAGGSVTLTASGASTYLWSTGATTASITVSTSGSYSVTGTSAAGCPAASAATTVTVNPLPAAPATTGGSRCGAGTVTLAASGTPTGGSYAWYAQSTGGTAISGATTGSYTTPSIATTTTYYVSAISAASCESPRTAVTATINLVPTVSIAAAGPTTFCAGGSVTLTASGAATYLWSNGATTPSITVSTSGSYSVTGTSAAGCPATSAATVVTVNPLPTVSIAAGGSTTFCQGGSVILTASGADSYLWSTGATTNSITVSTSGSYSVTGTSAAGCPATSAATTVTVNPLPTVSIAAGGPTTFCAGGTVTLTASGAATYLWSTGATTNSITVSTGGSYSVTGTSAAGCPATSAATTITVNPLPTAPTTTAANRCGPGSVTLGASGTPTGGSYAWYTTATGGTAISGATTGSYATPSLSATTTYYVSSLSAAGCESPRTAVTATINTIPTVSIAAGGPTSFCAGGSVTLTASGADSYLWSTGATTASITVSTGGSYSVTGTSTAGCAATSAATTVTVNPLPTAPTTTAANRCGPGAVTLTASGTPTGGTYAWYTAATGGPAISGATAASYTTPALTATTTYYVSALSAAGCESPRTAVTATINTVPTVSIAPNGPTTFCAGGSVTLTAAGADTYLWSNGATTASITINASGSYSVTGTSTAGCSASPAATVITVNPLPTVSIAATGSTTFCAGGSVTLTASGTDTYLWSSGETTASITVTASGSYTVTGTSAAGCVATSAATTVTVNPLPTAPTVTPAASCVAASLTLAASGAPAGGSYAWYTQATGGTAIAGATTGSYTTPVLSATTTYYVSALSDAGCEGPRTAVTATINATPVVTITPDGPTTFCPGGSVTLTASGANTYLWSTGATTASITVSASGSYTVTGTVAAGCVAAPVSTTITVNPAPIAPTTTPAATCGPGSVTLTATGAATGETYAWYTAATGGTALAGATTGSYTTPSLTTTTTYYVSVLNASGCESPRTPVLATINLVPTVGIAAAGATSFCQGGSVVLTASGADTYLWSTGATTASITVSASGSYSVTGTTTAGCSAASAATTVTAEPLPATPVITQGPSGMLTSSAATGNQWYFGPTAIPGATGATYVVTSAAGNGSYTVVVTSATGCVSLPSAAVTVTITATTPASLLAGLKVWPNPAHATLTVQVPAVAGASAATLALLDGLGRVVQTETVALTSAATPTRHALDLRGLAAGLYVVRLTVNGRTAIQRVIVD